MNQTAPFTKQHWLKRCDSSTEHFFPIAGNVSRYFCRLLIKKQCVSFSDFNSIQSHSYVNALTAAEIRSRANYRSNLASLPASSRRRRPPWGIN